jgi:hypothetical protein
MIPIIKIGDILDLSDKSLKKWLTEVQKIKCHTDLFVVDEIVKDISTTIKLHVINKKIKITFELNSCAHVYSIIVGNIFYKKF